LLPPQGAVAGLHVTTDPVEELRVNLVRLALRRPVTVVIAVVAMLLAAALAIVRMPRDIFPTLGIPTIYVAQPYGGMDPAQMEGFLNDYYEYHFLYITGIEHVESKSIQGAAIIKLQFYPGTDMSQAMSEVVSYVNRARAFMPPGTVPPFVTRFDAGNVPVGDLVFTSATRTVGELQDAALNRVRPLFATLPGVSAPPPFGGSARSIVISLQPDRLRALNMSPDEVVSAVTTANLISPSGNMPLGDSYPMVPLNATVKNIQDLADVPIRTGVYPTVFLRDVATVNDGSDIVTSYALVNGRRTVYIPVTKRSDASTLTVVNLVRQNLPRFQAALPPDVKVSYDFDQSRYVTGAINGLTLEATLGAVLTGIMVLLFLRDWTSALIVVITIPVSLLGSLVALWLTGQTVNLMTLGGLALAVGVLVDMSTVAIENVHTHLSQGKTIHRAVADSGREVALPLLIAMLCVLAVFVPSFFMQGAARALFVPLALAVGFAMAVSFLLANTLVPILSAWWIRAHASRGAHDRVSAFERFQMRCDSLISSLLRRPTLVVAAYLLVAGALIVALGVGLGTDIFPKVDAGQLQVRLRAPAGTRIDGTEQVALRTLDLISQTVGSKNVDITLGFVGVHGSAYPINFIYLWNGGPEEAVLQVQLKAGTAWHMDGLKERLRARFATEMPTVEYSFEPADIISRIMSFGSATPVEVAVSGSDLTAVTAFAQRVRDAMAGIPSLRDVQFAQSLSYPTVDVQVDRQKAGLEGVRMSDVSRSLVTATSSSRFVVPNYWADPNSGVAYQIQVQMPQSVMDSIEQVRNLPITAGGRSVLLRNIASVEQGTTVGQYQRYNMQRTIAVTANVARADLGSAASAIDRRLASLGKPPAGVNVAVRGQIAPMREILAGLRAGLLLAVVAILLLLAANYQSVRLAVVVVATTPAVIAGVVLALRVTGTTLNIQSFMGAIMAVGVAVANAVLLVTFAERSRHAGATAVDAARDAARTRLRPILMTSLAMIAGMLPMALGVGEAGPQAAPLGRAVIGGLALATVATLLVLPGVFALVQSRAHRQSASLDPDDAESRAFATAQ
jgi:multidrug efflux pump subunit AcrB